MRNSGCIDDGDNISNDSKEIELQPFNRVSRRSKRSCKSEKSAKSTKASLHLPLDLSKVSRYLGLCLGAFNNYVDKMGGGGQKMSVFVHA